MTGKDQPMIRKALSLLLVFFLLLPLPLLAEEEDLLIEEVIETVPAQEAATADSIEAIAATWRDGDTSAVDLPDEARELIPETPEEGFSEER